MKLSAFPRSYAIVSVSEGRSLRQEGNHANTIDLSVLRQDIHIRHRDIHRCEQEDVHAQGSLPEETIPRR